MNNLKLYSYYIRLGLRFQYVFLLTAYILKEYVGKKQNEIKEENIECSKCPKRFKYFKENDKYGKALEKLYKKEEENNAKI